MQRFDWLIQITNLLSSRLKDDNDFASNIDVLGILVVFDLDTRTALLPFLHSFPLVVLLHMSFFFDRLKGLFDVRNVSHNHFVISTLDDNKISGTTD